MMTWGGVGSRGQTRQDREKSMVVKCHICVWASNNFHLTVPSSAFERAEFHMNFNPHYRLVCDISAQQRNCCD